MAMSEQLPKHTLSKFDAPAREENLYTFYTSFLRNMQTFRPEFWDAVTEVLDTNEKKEKQIAHAEAIAHLEEKNNYIAEQREHDNRLATEAEREEQQHNQHLINIHRIDMFAESQDAKLFFDALRELENDVVDAYIEAVKVFHSAMNYVHSTQIQYSRHRTPELAKQLTAGKETLEQARLQLVSIEQTIIDLLKKRLALRQESYFERTDTLDKFDTTQLTDTRDDSTPDTT
jgi:hypothetical protein